MTRGRVRASAALSVIAYLCWAAPAMAQQVDAAPSADSEEGDAIVVTGQRAAERRAIDRKRGATGIQDSVAANDVGKLPDQNVAEAVRRIPGVSVANDQGEGRYVIIRGSDPNLANVTLNGQTAPAPEPDGRQVKLDDIPSSLIGSVDVIKALTADRDANAIAGQVDINTLSAFDRPGTFVYARGAAGIYALNNRSPYEVDGTVGSRFGGDLGLVLSANYSRRPIASENVQGSTNWRQVNGFTVPDDFRLRRYDLVRTRYGGVANIDYRPSSDFQLFGRFLYSVFKDNETRDQTRIEIPTTITNQTATSGTFSGRGTAFLRRREEDDKTFNGELGGKFALGGARLEVSGGYSRALKTDPLRSEFSFRTGSSTITGNVYDLSETVFRVNRGDAAFNPASYQGYRVNYDRRRAVEDLYQGRADLTIPMGGESSIKLGGKYQERNKSNNRDFEQYNLASSTNLATNGASYNDGLATYEGRYPFGPRINYNLAQTYYTVTNPGARTLDAAGSVGNSLVNDYVVNEKIYAGYVMGTFVAGDLTIIPGVRVEHTKDETKGKTITATSTAAQGFNSFGSTDYTDWFPSLNLRLDANDKFTARAAVTTAIGRPNYDDLAPFVQVDTSGPTVALGNPNIKPLKSVNGDVSLEYYLSNHGLISVAGFYKRIEDPIVVFGQTGISGTFAGTALTNATVTQPLNGDRAEIYGVEVNAQLPFDFLPGFLSGFGINANYTRTGGQARGLPGRAGSFDNYLQSKNVASAQLYYERDGLALRVAWSYRSAYLDTVGTTKALDQYTADHEQWDARASFEIVKQATLFVEGSNLSDSPWRRWIGNPGQLAENERYGAMYRTGIQLAF
jgi:TonB-dependent receptor